jgi:hypothetical protein
MAVAAVTPRVRTIVIGDGVSPSEIESGVFNLEGVRQHRYAESFPSRCELSVFLLLSSPRKGKYAGKIVIVHDRTEKVIRYVKFLTTFQEANELLPLYVEMEACVFPEPGLYTFQVIFTAPAGDDVLKGEHPFSVLTYEE